MTITSAPPPAARRTSSRSFPLSDAAAWRRIRRYAVPRWMIEQATERRLAGDWRGACAAANVDVTFDLADVAGEHGKEVAADLENDLCHFAPDLLRWHLPRVGRGYTTITPSQTVILGEYGGRVEETRQEATQQLYVTTPSWGVHMSQRLSLHLGEVSTDAAWSYLETDWRFCSFWRYVVHDWTTAGHLWDVRHIDELRERCGGDKERVPFFNADGTPRTADRLPTSDPGTSDPVTHTEWVTTLHEKGEVEAAFTAAGIDLDATGFNVDIYEHRIEPIDIFGGLPLALTRLAPEMRRLNAGKDRNRFWIPHTQHTAILLETDRPETGPRVKVIEIEGSTETPDGAVVLPEASWRRLPDLDLLRHGHISPEQLHPLVRDALFPNRARADRPAGPPDVEFPSSVRVRCHGEWHDVSFRDGTLHIPHSAEEQQREDAMRAFGGATSGCFAAQHAWRSGAGKLPKALRDQRQELFARVYHGDTPGVIRLLDAGVDPFARDTRRRTLLHTLHLLDHRLLLPRLLAAGLDIEARDEDQRTPLFTAVCQTGSTEVINALLAAGARIDVTGEIHGEALTLYRMIKIYDWPQFLGERIEREHPELTEEEEE